MLQLFNKGRNPFPHLKGKGGLHYHPSRNIIGGQSIMKPSERVPYIDAHIIGGMIKAEEPDESFESILAEQPVYDLSKVEYDKIPIPNDEDDIDEDELDKLIPINIPEKTLQEYIKENNVKGKLTKAEKYDVLKDENIRREKIAIDLMKKKYFGKPVVAVKTVKAKAETNPRDDVYKSKGKLKDIDDVNGEALKNELIRLKQSHTGSKQKLYDKLKEFLETKPKEKAIEKVDSKEEANIKAMIGDVKYALKDLQHTKPYLSLSNDDIRNVAIATINHKSFDQPWQLLQNEGILNKSGIKFIVNEDLKHEIILARKNKSYIDGQIIPFVKAQKIPYGIAYEYWIERHGQTLMKSISGTTGIFIDSSKNPNVKNGNGRYCPYDFYNKDCEIETKYYVKESYFEKLKNDKDGFKFQKAKFIGRQDEDENAEKFKPYFILDGDRILLYNILQIYTNDKGESRQRWINDTNNREVYFQVCCSDTMIYLNINDLNLVVDDELNPTSKGPKKLITIDIDSMIQDGGLLQHSDSEYVNIQAKYFKQVQNI